MLQPGDLGEPGALADLLAYAPDVLVACAYGRIVPAQVFDALPSLVVHPSLVPHWRGAAPVVRALMAGETRLGVATLQMVAGVDEGPVADEQPVTVPRDADAARAYELLAGPAADSLLTTLSAVADGTVAYRPQEGPADYAAKITEADRAIDWRRPARPSPTRCGRCRPTSALTPSSAAGACWSGRRRRTARCPATPSGATAWSCPAGDGVLEILGAARGRTPAHDRPGVPARRRPAPGAEVAGCRNDGGAGTPRRLRRPAGRGCDAGALRLDAATAPEFALSQLATAPSPTSS